METGVDLQRAFQPYTELFARDFDQTELVEVRIVELGIQKNVAAINQARREMNQRNL